MKTTTTVLVSGTLALGLAIMQTALAGQARQTATIPIDADDIGGVVTGPKGPKPASG